MEEIEQTNLEELQEEIDRFITKWIDRPGKIAISKDFMNNLKKETGEITTILGIPIEVEVEIHSINGDNCRFKFFRTVLVEEQ